MKSLDINKFYLLGCDSTEYDWKSTNGYFLGKDNNKESVKMKTVFVYFWIRLYQFMCENYPKTKIISVNPVGIKGLMHEDLFL